MRYEFLIRQWHHFFQYRRLQSKLIISIVNFLLSQHRLRKCISHLASIEFFMASCLQEKTTTEEKTTKWNCMMQTEKTCRKWSSGILYSIRLFEIFRAFHFILYFHIRLKIKLWGPQNCPQSTEAGMYPGSDLVKVMENVSSRKRRPPSVWNGRSLEEPGLERWSSDQSEQSEERGLEMCPWTLWLHHVWRKPGSLLCLHHPYSGVWWGKPPADSWVQTAGAGSQNWAVQSIYRFNFNRWNFQNDTKQVWVSGLDWISPGPQSVGLKLISLSPRLLLS